MSRLEQPNFAIFARDGSGMASYRRGRHRKVGLLVALSMANVLQCGGGSFAQTDVPESFFESRPAFSRAEQVPRKPASCEDIAAQLPADIPREVRIDMAIAGPVTLLQSDGALWYVAVCAEPGIRALCVTYDSNGLKLGDGALLRGGYSRQNPRHILLDPCLASPDPADGN